MPRPKFYLVLTKDPPALDVVRENQMRNVHTAAINQECVFQWEKSPNTFEDVSGRVLRIGMKKDLVRVKVNADGEEVAEGDGLKTRKQEIERARMQQVNAQRLHLQDIAGQLLADGTDAVSDNLQPVMRVPKPSRLPKKRGADTMEELKKMVGELPCFSPGESKTQLCLHKPVYCDSGKLTVARLKYKRQPKRLHSALLRLCIPENIWRLDGISRTDKRGCVGIDPVINETIALYVSGVFVKAGGAVNDLDYDPDAVMDNLFDNTKAKKGRWRIIEPGMEAADEPGPSGTQTIMEAPAAAPNIPAASEEAQGSEEHTYATLANMAPTRVAIEVDVPFHNF